MLYTVCIILENISALCYAQLSALGSLFCSALYMGKIMYCLNVLLKWIAEWVAWHGIAWHYTVAVASIQ